MERADLIRDVMTRLRVYVPDEAREAGAVFDQWQDACRGFSEDEVAEAVRDLQRTWTSNQAPKPAHLIGCLNRRQGTTPEATAASDLARAQQWYYQAYEAEKTKRAEEHGDELRELKGLAQTLARRQLVEDPAHAHARELLRTQDAPHLAAYARKLDSQDEDKKRNDAGRPTSREFYRSVGYEV